MHAVRSGSLSDMTTPPLNPRAYSRLRQIRVARVAISMSTARGQGPGGTVQAARQFLARVNLGRLASLDARRFARQLDALTEALRNSLPGRHPSWGSARKFLNIFLRDALYDAELRRAHRLWRVERLLEVPIDGDVGRRLIAEPEGHALPRWKTIRALEAETHREFQRVARRVAVRVRIHRVHLDLLYWSGMNIEERAL